MNVKPTNRFREVVKIMRPRNLFVVLVTAIIFSTMTVDVAVAEEVHPLAIFPFQERGTGVQGYGEKVSDLLFASLVADSRLFLVDRADFDKVIEEQQLGASGVVRPDEAARIGTLTGAKLLVTGSVIETDAKIYLVAKIIGTETSRVLGETVKGGVDDDLSMLVERLARQVADTVDKRHDRLVAPPTEIKDVVVALNDVFGNAERPAITIEATERHIGQAIPDPATETEMTRICIETGMEVFEQAARGKANFTIKLEGFSEFAGRVGDLVAVKARVELKVIDQKTSQVIVADRQTSIVIDLAENVAGKAALQQATIALAERALPKIVNQ